jgi:hypothetical protein
VAKYDAEKEPETTIVNFSAGSVIETHEHAGGFHE